MDYRQLGRSGLKVSRLGLGCMSFGDPGKGPHAWVLAEEESRALIRRAVELGVTFFDTANVYSLGASEEVVGRALRDFARREEVVVATKLRGVMRPDDPNSGGLSRKAIFTEIDASLKRLAMDYVDLYQVHRWDDATPLEETLEALHDVVKAGKALYVGASSMWAWQFMKALACQAANGWARFVSMQNHLNLLYREEEREMLPLCRDQGVGVIPYSPLGRGRLARRAPNQTARARQDRVARDLYDGNEPADEAIAERIREIAAARGVAPAQVALAWVLSKPEVSAPIVGVTRAEHLEEAVAACAMSLSQDELRRLQEPYRPRTVPSLF